MSPHPLDRPVWSALSTRQAQVAVGGELARRFTPDIGPLASARDDSPESLAALAELVPQDGSLILLQRDPILIPPGITAASTALGVQMVLERLNSVASGPRIERLGAEDIPAMVELATLTRPGPFARGTSRLGDFWGVKEDGVLLAMAGERMKLPGFSELSGVCTHPSARGRGFARILSRAVTAMILERGELPFLHAYASNKGAIQLYETLGFRLHSEVSVAVLKRTTIEARA